MTDRLLGAACLLLAAGMAWAAQDYVAEISYEPVGPRAFPLLLSGLLAAGGLWLMLKPSPLAGHYAQVPGRLLAVCLAAVFLYAFGFEVVGFPIATALMAIPLGMAFGGSAPKCLLAGLVMGVGLYFMFDRLLDVVLPAGWLAPLIKGL